MHRQVMNFPEQIIDHKTKINWINRKINLALSDKSKNGINRNAQINSKSGIKGVCFDNSKNRWRVFINKAGIRLGDRLFKDFITAVLYRKFWKENIMQTYNLGYIGNFKGAPYTTENDRSKDFRN